jgi:hypothetical protein
MDTITADTVKEQLMSNNPEFRELVREHHRYEERLSELSASHIRVMKSSWKRRDAEKEEAGNQRSDLFVDARLRKAREHRALIGFD